ncbi:MAG: Crp/Fnr family transcriptional regulator [Dichotomicrobium sp.]
MSSMIEQLDIPDYQSKRRNGTAHTARPVVLADVPLKPRALRFGPRRVAAGSDVVSEGSVSPACIVVQQGWAAPYKLLRDGRRQLLDLLLDGDGMRVCRDANGRACHAVLALTHAHVVEGTAEELARMGAIQPGSDPCAAPLFVEQQRRMMDRMAILGHGRAAERLAACLLDIWSRQQVRGNVDDAGSCPIPIRQSDLGDAVGLTAVHVCRTLTIFRRLGLLEFANGRLTMVRPEKLALIAGMDTERR